MRRIGKIPQNYPPLSLSGNLAEYIGVVLGDGNISKFPRTERIIISANSNNLGFVNRYTKLTKQIFNKKPTVSKVYNKNNIRIGLYQKEISKRLGIPSGDRGRLNIKTPNWILKNQSYLIRYLRGLFEAEGSLSVHKPTCTYNFQFSNKNQSLLKNVENGLKLLGYNPEIRKTSTRLRKKLEVEKFRKLIKFRVY
ncbi:MAG: LAGLIDADG family homing endonuclease [bacterium]|nr:LAGLIDADG family homing endonuclease [bacterium]